MLTAGLSSEKITGDCSKFLVMKIKLLAFGLAFSFLLSPALAQESLLDEGDGASDPTEDVSVEDLFGDDFFGDLDSFLELEDPGTPDPVVDDLAQVDLSAAPDVPQEEVSLPPVTEDLQSSALPATPGVLPASAQVNLSVINVSQNDANAQVSGAQPGDILRYEIALSSQTEDVVDFVPTVNVSNILNMVEITETGFGVLENGNIVYPAYSHQAPCDQVFTFFVRVLDNCVDGSALQVSSPEAGGTAVNLNCGLAQTGPAQRWLLLGALMVLLAVLGFGLGGRAKTS